MVKNPPAMQETQTDPWVGKIPWIREWLPTPVFLPGESHREKPGGLQSIGLQRVGLSEAMQVLKKKKKKAFAYTAGFV